MHRQFGNWKSISNGTNGKQRTAARLVTWRRFLLLCCFFLMSNNFDVSLWLNAARDVLHGVNPYHVANLINPIIVPVLFVPFTPLPDALVARLLAFASGAIAVTLLRREACHRWIVPLLLLTPIFLYSVYFPNLDWIVAAALLAPPPLAFLLAFLKPQIGLGVALLALLDVWSKNKPLAVILIVAEACIYAVSYAVGMRWQFALTTFNFAVFPYGLIVGLPLFWLSLRRRDAVIAFAAMPFCAPYIGAQSWIAILPLLARLDIRPQPVHDPLSRAAGRAGNPKPDIRNGKG